MTAVCACFVGIVLAIYVEWLSRRERRLLELSPLAASFRWKRAVVILGTTAILCGVFHWASIAQGCLETPEVQPSWTGRHWRLAYQLTLICFLIVATAVDFDCYTIPDAITVPGSLLGVIGACAIGEAQISHLWVDWSQAIPQIQGPYIPGWYDGHRVWHALAWSLAGLITGVSITWIARQISSLVLGQEAMGLGDVTLMAMIGSFLGWQAVILVFLIAPLTGLIAGVIIRMISGKPYLPYGPWLSIAAIIVLFTWTILWRQTRLIFSDWISVLVLGVAGGLGFVMLLMLLQLYKSIPTRGKSPNP